MKTAEGSLRRRAGQAGRWLAVLLVLAGSGCAFVDRSVPLNTVEEGSGGKGVESIAVFVPKPEDRRPTPGIVGNVRDGAGFKTAKVNARRDVPEWVRECVVRSLEASGVAVAKGDSSADPEAAVVKIAVIDVFCDVHATYEAEVHLAAEVVRGGEVVGSGTWRSRSERFNWTASGSGYERSLSEAMRACLRKMVPELRRMIAGSVSTTMEDSTEHETNEKEASR